MEGWRDGWMGEWMQPLTQSIVVEEGVCLDAISSIWSATASHCVEHRWSGFAKNQVGQQRPAARDTRFTVDGEPVSVTSTRVRIGISCVERVMRTGGILAPIHGLAAFVAWPWTQVCRRQQQLLWSISMTLSLPRLSRRRRPARFPKSVTDTVRGNHPRLREV